MADDGGSVLQTLFGAGKAAISGLANISVDVREARAREKMAQQQYKAQQQKFLLDQVKNYPEMLAHDGIGKLYDQAAGVPGLHEQVLTTLAQSGVIPGSGGAAAGGQPAWQPQPVDISDVPQSGLPAPVVTGGEPTPQAGQGAAARPPVGTTVTRRFGAMSVSKAGPSQTEANEQAFFDVFNQTRDILEKRGIHEGDAIAEGVRAAARATGSVPSGFREAFMAPYTQQVQLGTEVGRQNIQIQAAGPKAAAGEAGRQSVPVRPAPAERKFIADAQASLDGFENLRALFDPMIQGPVAGRAASVKDLFGGNTKQQSQFLSATRQLKQQVRFALTGAQASFSEIKEIEKALPQQDDPPKVWAAKWEEASKTVLRRLSAYHESLIAANVKAPPLRVPPNIQRALQPPPTSGAVQMEQPAAPAAPASPTTAEEYLRQKGLVQ